MSLGRPFIAMLAAVAAVTIGACVDGPSPPSPLRKMGDLFGIAEILPHLDSTYLAVGDTLRLSVRTNLSGDVNVEWSVQDTVVAEVGSTGLLLGKAPGTTAVRVVVWLRSGAGSVSGAAQVNVR